MFSRFIKMAEMLAYLVRLLVVRCLAFVVVQAETVARGSSGGSSGVNAGTRASLCSAGIAEAVSKSTDGLSVCVSTFSAICVRVSVRFASVLLSGALCSTGAASSALTGEKIQLELLPARGRLRGTE